MDLFTETTTLRPVAPYDFAQSLRFVGMFSPTHQEQNLENQTLTKGINLAGQFVVFRLASLGTPEAPELKLEIFSKDPLSERTRAEAVMRVRFFLSLDDDLRTFYSRAQEDAAFGSVVNSLYGLHQVKFLTPFENACWAVLCQRCPIPVARVMKRALIEAFSPSLEVDGVVYRAFPEVAQLAWATDRELLALIGNERKAAYLRAVIEAFLNVDEQFLVDGDYEEVNAWLKGIKGIGEWSADFVLLRGLGRMRRLHFYDNSIPGMKMLNAAFKIYQRNLDAARLSEIAEDYADHQVYWAYYLRSA